eukprot:g2545.t1
MQDNGPERPDQKEIDPDDEELLDLPKVANLLPPEGAMVEFRQYKPIIDALLASAKREGFTDEYMQQQAFENSNTEFEDALDVQIFNDPELEVLAGAFAGKSAEVVELDGPKASLVFNLHGTNSNIIPALEPWQCQLPEMAIQVKHLQKFVTFHVNVSSTKGSSHTLHFDNKTTVTRVKNDGEDLFIPLKLCKGWNYLNLDLRQLLESATGLEYQRCNSVTITGSCRLWKVFLQEREYADAELPGELQVL